MTTNTIIQELIERVIELSQSYAIWWELVDPENSPKYKNTITKHEDFFRATVHAHLQSIMIVLYQLFDKRKKTKSIFNLFSALESTDSQLIERLRKDIDPHWQILTKVFDIRGNVYAHRNVSLSPEEVFVSAKLSVNALGALVSLAEDIIAELADVTGVGARTELIAEFERRADYARDGLQCALRAFSERAD